MGRYEQKLKAEQDLTLSLKGENVIMKKKYQVLVKEVKEQDDEIRGFGESEKQLRETLKVRTGAGIAGACPPRAREVGLRTFMPSIHPRPIRPSHAPVRPSLKAKLHARMKRCPPGRHFPKAAHVWGAPKERLEV